MKGIGLLAASTLGIEVVAVMIDFEQSPAIAVGILFGRVQVNSRGKIVEARKKPCQTRPLEASIPIWWFSV